MLYSIIIPCYNSEKSLPELMERIDTTMTSAGMPYEVICVNDCSRDNTLEVLRGLSARYTTLTAIDMVYNVGQFKALICAMEHSNGDVVITIDDDLQHRPEDIPLLVNHLNANPQLDVVIGAYRQKKHKAYRNLGTIMMRAIDKHIFGKPQGLKTSSFRAMRRILADTIVEHKTQFPVMGPLILQLTRRIENVEVEHQSRKYGKSGYSLSKLIKTTFDNILNFSSLPLKVISWVGTVAASISMLLALYYMLRYMIMGSNVPGWTSLMVMLNFFCGLILLSIGIIGEYLIRILKESNHSPRYSIREVIGKETR